MLVGALLAALWSATPPRCGTTQARKLNGRDFLLHLPCSDSPIALAVLVHCYGCTAEMEIKKYADEASTRSIGLVAPVGTESSFNAPHCCGFAQHSSVNDVEFIDAIVDHLHSDATISFAKHA